MSLGLDLHPRASQPKALEPQLRRGGAAQRLWGGLACGLAAKPRTVLTPAPIPRSLGVEVMIMGILRRCLLAGGKARTYV